MISTTLHEPAREEREVEVHLIAVSHAVLRRQIEITYGPIDDSTPPKPIREELHRLVVAGEWYDELLSDSPEWAPGKPGGVYRDEDLLDFVLWVRPKMESRHEELPAERIAQEKQKKKDAEKRKKKRKKEREAANKARSEARAKERREQEKERLKKLKQKREQEHADNA